MVKNLSKWTGIDIFIDNVEHFFKNVGKFLLQYSSQSVNVFKFSNLEQLFSWKKIILLIYKLIESMLEMRKKNLLTTQSVNDFTIIENNNLALVTNILMLWSYLLHLLFPALG